LPVSRSIPRISARLCGSRSHKTKKLLAELADGKEGEFPKTVGPVFTTDHKPPEDTDEVVADLLAAMSALQVRALAACARMAEDRDAAGA
jgi:hypothetical protein